jgi:hypothetical protein
VVLVDGAAKAVRARFDGPGVSFEKISIRDEPSFLFE